MDMFCVGIDVRKHFLPCVSSTAKDNAYRLKELTDEDAMELLVGACMQHRLIS